MGICSLADWFAIQMPVTMVVRYSDTICLTDWYSEHHLSTGLDSHIPPVPWYWASEINHLNNKQVKVCYSDVTAIQNPFVFVLNSAFFRSQVSLNAEIAPEPEKPAPEAHAKKEAHPHPEKPAPEEDPESDLELDMTGVVGEIFQLAQIMENCSIDEWFAIQMPNIMGVWFLDCHLVNGPVFRYRSVIQMPSTLVLGI